jgi:hypothetical protein
MSRSALVNSGNAVLGGGNHGLPNGNGRDLGASNGGVAYGVSSLERELISGTTPQREHQAAYADSATGPQARSGNNYNNASQGARRGSFASRGGPNNPGGNSSTNNNSNL